MSTYIPQVGDRVRVTSIGSDIAQSETEADKARFPYPGDEGVVTAVDSIEPDAIWVELDDKPFVFSDGWPLFASEVEPIEAAA